MDRRQFCTHACQALSATTLASLVGACGDSPTSPSNTSTVPTVAGSLNGTQLTVPVDAASPLATVGGAGFVQTGGRIFLLFRVSQDTVNTLTGVCTHEGCSVTGIANQTFVCPCHGSQFSTSGSVVQGPASRPLQTFPTTFANNVVTAAV